MRSVRRDERRLGRPRRRRISSRIASGTSGINRICQPFVLDRKDTFFLQSVEVGALTLVVPEVAERNDLIGQIAGYPIQSVDDCPVIVRNAKAPPCSADASSIAELLGREQARQRGPWNISRRKAIDLGQQAFNLRRDIYSTFLSGALYEVKLGPIIPIKLSDPFLRTGVSAKENAVDQIPIAFDLADQACRDFSVCPIAKGGEVRLQIRCESARGVEQ